VEAEGPPMIAGFLEVLYTAGVADTISGDVSVLDDPCQSQFTFTDQPFTGLTATPPNATVTARVTDGVDLLTGDIVMEGSNVATASMSFNSGAPIDFTINLSTGVVALAP